MTRILLHFFGVLGVGMSIFLLLINAAPSPEKVILGEWKEMAWVYERVDPVKQSDEDYEQVAAYVKNSLHQNLVIHKAETWTFLPGGKLKLVSQENEELVAWRIKGRGHVLEIKHDDGSIEYYNLTELGSDKMILNFDSDMQVRGIAKLTFEKISPYVTQIQ